MKCYRNIDTDEVVYKEEAEEYALERLGITIKPKGQNGEMTIEQLENIEETINWYFSGNWIEEEIKEVEEASIFELIKEESELEDDRSKVWRYTKSKWNNKYNKYKAEKNMRK